MPYAEQYRRGHRQVPAGGSAEWFRRASLSASIHFLLFALFRQCLIAISDPVQALKARQCVRAVGHVTVRCCLRAQYGGGSLRDELMLDVQKLRIWLYIRDL
jgi:hypothetical protein